MATPLRHISVVAEVLQKGLEKDGARVNQALADIKLTSDRILTDSISLINWIKYSNKTIPVKKKTIHLHSLAKDTLQLHDSSARSKGIELKNEIEKWWFIEADHTILSTIFNNIISNAVKIFAFRRNHCFLHERRCKQHRNKNKR
ncbi:MAG: sensor histidine kinase [Agriterribacter sp.]